MSALGLLLLLAAAAAAARASLVELKECTDSIGNPIVELRRAVGDYRCKFGWPEPANMGGVAIDIDGYEGAEIELEYDKTLYSKVSGATSMVAIVRRGDAAPNIDASRLGFVVHFNHAECRKDGAPLQLRARSIGRTSGSVTRSFDQICDPSVAAEAPRVEAQTSAASHTIPIPPVSLDNLSDGTATFFIIWLLVVLACCCIACIYVNPN